MLIRHLINRTVRQMLKHSLILSLQHRFFFSSFQSRTCPWPQTCSHYTTPQPQRDDYLTRNNLCLGLDLLSDIHVEVKQVSQADLRDTSYSREKKIYCKHKLLKMITVQEMIYASIIEVISIISLGMTDYPGDEYTNKHNLHA